MMSAHLVTLCTGNFSLLMSGSPSNSHMGAHNLLTADIKPDVASTTEICVEITPTKKCPSVRKLCTATNVRSL